MCEVIGTEKLGIVCILLDTGASVTIILRDAIRGLTGQLHKETFTKWHTMGGNFLTKFKLEINLKLMGFSMWKIIQWECHVDTSIIHKTAQYDMIIGADLLSELGIEINFNTQWIVWEGVKIPMKEKLIVSNLKNAMAIYYQGLKPIDQS